MSYKNHAKTPQAVQACHELLLWLIPLLDSFPRNRRFTLGERLEVLLIDNLPCMYVPKERSNNLCVG